MPKVAVPEPNIRQEVSRTIASILKMDDNSILSFKLEVLKELHKAVKQKPHHMMEHWLLDCLVLHDIMVDETKAKVIDESTKRSSQLHDQLLKLRKKGKYQEYREMKSTLVSELRETDAIGVDLARVSTTNNEIIKCTLGIYFEILKHESKSPLLRSVFLGLPQFTQYVNIEIVWDLIAVLREYFIVQIGGETESMNVPNILSGLLCAFQILEVGAGSNFNIDEKDFFSALYAVLQTFLFGNDLAMSVEKDKDFLGLLKCLDIVFCQRRELSAEVIDAFVKRLATIQMHLD